MAGSVISACIAMLGLAPLIAWADGPTQDRAASSSPAQMGVAWSVGQTELLWSVAPLKLGQLVHLLSGDLNADAEVAAPQQGGLFKTNLPIPEVRIDAGQANLYRLKLREHGANGTTWFAFSGGHKVAGGWDLDGDGKAESFRQCVSSEGVHLTVWSGEPLKGKRIFHAYVPLGYDTEPNCTPADYGALPR
jgi:hypothetical protein